MDNIQNPRNLPAPFQPNDGIIDVREEINRSITYKTNLGVEVVTTTRDKITVALTDALPRYVKRHTWLEPLGLTITLLITVLTAEFQPIGKVSAEALTGVFWALTLVSGGWSLKKLWGIWNVMDRDDVVDAIVKTNSPPDSEIIRG